MSEDFETLRKQLGDLNWKAELDTHVNRTFIGAVSGYTNLLIRQRKHPVSEAFSHTHDEARHLRRRQIIAYFRHCFGYHPVLTDKPHPRAILWSEGAIVADASLVRLWNNRAIKISDLTQRRENSARRSMLHFAIDEATRQDNWPAQDIAEPALLSGVDTAYAYSPELIISLTQTGEDRDEGETRAWGAAWLLGLAEHIETTDHAINPDALAKKSLRRIIKALRHPSSDE